MSKYQIRDNDKFYFLTFTVVNWIDVFIRDYYCDILVENLRYCQEKKSLEIGAWCIMSNHVHGIFRGGRKDDLASIIRDFKKYTSKRLLEAIDFYEQPRRKGWMLWMMGKAGEKQSSNKDLQFWEHYNHPKEIYSNSILEQKIHYIHQNPVKAGIVEQPEYWKYSSGKDYELGERGLIEVTHLL